MSDLVFFYGTLMSGFRRRRRIGARLFPLGRGFIHAVLFDLGPYPGAIPGSDARVWGELHQMADADAALHEFDRIEGFDSSEPETSLYVRHETLVTLDDGRSETAWVYFYNAPLGEARRIESGDYRDHLKVGR